MTILALLLILIISAVIFGAVAVIAKTKKLNAIPLFILTVLVTIGLIYLLILMSVAASHGMKTLAAVKGESMVNMPVSMLSFEGFSEDKLPENTKGAIIIFVKYGCPDCIGIAPTIRDLAAYDNVYIIHSTSPVGQELIQKYNIADVPSAVYVRINDYNGGLEYTQKSLYTKDDLGNITPNMDNINRLFELQNQQK